MPSPFVWSVCVVDVGTGEPPTTQRLVDAVRAAGGSVDYRTHEREQHGLRAPVTIADAIDAR